jgi:hypothetical protein
MKISSPKSPQEIAEQLLVEKGIYPGRVANARETRSQSDRDMLVVTIALMTSSGTVIDRITEARGNGQRLGSFCEALGLLEAYEAGELHAADCIGRAARCVVAVIRSEKYGTRNEIAAYLPAVDVSSEARVRNVS